MEWGKIDIQQLNNINFVLPPEPVENLSLLNKNIKPDTQVFFGCARWGTKDWLGHFYPEYLKEKDFLHYYSTLFNCVELNTTYYQVPAIEQVKHWKEQVSSNFRFCPKFPQVITHVMRLQRCDKEVNEFVTSIAAFEETLGPVFLMPNPQMGINELPLIKRFIERLPGFLDVFIELRHSSWFEHGLNEQLYDFVKDYNIGLVITDAAGKRDNVHMHLSKPETFIRFVGNGLHSTDYARIQQWIKRLQLWMKEGIEKIYFFMHQNNSLNAPQLNKYLIEEINASSSVHFPAIPAIRPQATLFD
ncbi:MAG: DUF72 domain-containing protein [Bacteroidota bacterium]|nr:DUF72 domain-containing protein [Bacteroidota bacterium]